MGISGTDFVRLHACNVSLVNEAERLRRVQLEPRDHFRNHRQMYVPLAVDKSRRRMFQLSPLLRSSFYAAILFAGCELRIGRVIFEAGMR
jgi:hypothetical protein